MTISASYAAGLFDGEGWFAISRTSGSRTRSRRQWTFQAHAAMALREKWILEGLAERYGGTVREQKSYSDKHARYYRWRVTGENALAVALDLESLLLAKPSQACLVVKFQQSKQEQGNRPLSDDQYLFYEDCYEEMKRLNTKGGSGSYESQYADAMHTIASELFPNAIKALVQEAR